MPGGGGPLSGGGARLDSRVLQSPRSPVSGVTDVGEGLYRSQLKPISRFRSRALG
jgi:hypothetical protein